MIRSSERANIIPVAVHSQAVRDRIEWSVQSATLHHGNIASGNEVIKDGPTHDRIAQQEDFICFRMETAGPADSFMCVIIRGVCDCYKPERTTCGGSL